LSVCVLNHRRLRGEFAMGRGKRLRSQELLLAGVSSKRAL